MTNSEEGRRLLREALLRLGAELPESQDDPVAVDQWLAAHPDVASAWISALSDGDRDALAELTPSASVTEEEVERFERRRQVAAASVAAPAVSGAWHLPGGAVFGAARALVRADPAVTAQMLGVSDKHLHAIEAGRQAWHELKRSQLERFAVIVELPLRALVGLLRSARDMELHARSPRFAVESGPSCYRDAVDGGGTLSDDAVHRGLVADYEQFFEQFRDLDGPARTSRASRP